MPMPPTNLMSYQSTHPESMPSHFAIINYSPPSPIPTFFEGRLQNLLPLPHTYFPLGAIKFLRRRPDLHFYIMCFSRHFALLVPAFPLIFYLLFFKAKANWPISWSYNPPLPHPPLSALLPLHLSFLFPWSSFAVFPSGIFVGRRYISIPLFPISMYDVFPRVCQGIPSTRPCYYFFHLTNFLEKIGN